MRLACLLLVLGAVAAAAPSATASVFVINRVEVDDAAGQVEIHGLGFGTDQPIVSLEGTPMVVVSHTDTEIVTTLPAGTVPGTYLLRVVQGTPSGPLIKSMEVSNKYKLKELLDRI